MSGGLGVQDGVAALAAAGALGWLLRRAWLRRRAKRCACDGCPAGERAEAAAAPPAERGGGSLVSIEGLGPKRS